MSDAEFKKLMYEQLARCINTLDAKRDEYANIDRLSAFRAAANLQNTSIERTIGGMMAKHVISVYQLIKSDCGDIEMWREKITDLINYLLLLESYVESEAQND